MKYAKMHTPPRVDDPILNRALQGLDDELKKIGRVLNSIDGLYYTETELNTLLAAQDEFKELSDTPSAYTGHSLKNVRVNVGETGLEFVAPGAPEAHASTHEVGGDDLLTFADITGFGTYLDQVVKTTSNVSFGTLGSGKLTVNAGAGCSIIIKGTSTGNANLGWIGFYDSDGTTRRGHIGDGSVGNDDIYIGADTGYLRLLAAGYISLGTHTYFPDDVVMSFGASLDYSIGYYSTDDEFQIVDGTTLDSNVRLKLDSSGHFDFGAGNLTTTGTLGAGNATLGTIASADITVDAKLVLSAGSITDGDGAISFGDEHLSTTGTLTLPNQGLHLLDTGGDHDLIIAPGSDLGADRILTLTTGDAARTITLSGNPTLADWFDQAVKQASNVEFNDLITRGNVYIDTDAGNKAFYVTRLGAINQSLKIYVDDANVYFLSEQDEDAGVQGGFIFDMDDDGTQTPYFQIKLKSGAQLFKVDHLGTVTATTFEGNLHWDYITNEPTYYPPEYHYHVGRDIVSLHLVDLDDVEADDIFDVLPTATIHDEGNYDWFGTWTDYSGASCSAEVVVLSGEDKMLRLTDGSNGTYAYCTLAVAADHPMVISTIQFKIRQSSNSKQGWFSLTGSGTTIYILMDDDGDMKFFDGANTTVLQAYAADTWYTVRIYCDCVAQGASVFVGNVFKTRKDLTGLDYVDTIGARTQMVDTGYTVDINELKIFNLTI